MKMESNGQKSCGEKSRHIHIIYFFIKDVLKREDIELIHCPTKRMIADYYTKPLQGSLFKRFRDQIMGVVAVQDPGPGKTKPAKKPVLKKPSKGKETY